MVNSESRQAASFIGRRMAFTQQQEALAKIQKLFGETAFTEDTMNYRLVGFKRGSTKLYCIGDTWEEAIGALGRKAGK